MSARTTSAPVRSSAAHRLGRAVAAAWADCRYASLRLTQIQTGVPRG